MSVGKRESVGQARDAITYRDSLLRAQRDAERAS